MAEEDIQGRRITLLRSLAWLLLACWGITLGVASVFWVHSSFFVVRSSSWTFALGMLPALAEQSCSVVFVQLAVAKTWTTPVLLRWDQWLGAVVVSVLLMAAPGLLSIFQGEDLMDVFVVLLLSVLSQLVTAFVICFVFLTMMSVFRTYLVDRRLPRVLPRRRWSIAGIMMVTFLAAFLIAAHRLTRAVVSWHWGASASVELNWIATLVSVFSYLFVPVLVVWAAAFWESRMARMWSIIPILLAVILRIVDRVLLNQALDSTMDLAGEIGAGVGMLVALVFAFLVHLWCFRCWRQAGFDLVFHVRGTSGGFFEKMGVGV